MSVKQEESLEMAAIVMLAIGKDSATKIMGMMSQREVQRLSVKMTQVKNLTQDRISQAALACMDKSRSRSSLGMNSDSYIKDVLTSALGEEKAGFLLDRMMQGSDTSGIESLKWLDPGSVAELLKNEHPQIIAATMVHLERDHAAAVLNRFPEKLRKEVIIRISTLDGIHPNALRELNEVLSRVLSGGDKIKKSTLGGKKTAAEILNFVGTTSEQIIFEGLRDFDSELATAIEEEMFVFDDLSSLDDRTMSIIIRDVDEKLLVPALKGVSESLKKKILACMSSTKAEALQDELNDSGPVKLADVEMAQKDILKLVRKMDEEGKIVLNGGSEEAYV